MNNSDTKGFDPTLSKSGAEQSQDRHFMQLAIDSAALGLYTTSPNPRVGCVLVRDGKVIGRAHHIRAGEGHAEINAIADAEDKRNSVAGCTTYVTLEPCSHTGKTPPCCEALIDAGVSRVVVAMIDPSPQVAGSGIGRLQAAGIAVEVGVLEASARELNPGFIKRMETGMPWLRAKLAMSLDGRTAMASGESKWITGAAARSDVQRLRAQSCAIICGVDTVIADRALLTVRENELGLDTNLAATVAKRQPLRVILDSNLRLPATSPIISQPGNTLIVAVRENAVAQQALVAAGAEVIYVPGEDTPETRQRVNLRQLMKILADRQCNEVLLETGATLAGAMTAQGLVDSYVIYMAASFMGSTARPLLNLPIESMADKLQLQINSITPVGSDWRIDAITQN